MSDDPKPTDPKAELEQRILQRAMAPYEPWLDEAERDGMRLVLNLFVTTHPAMRRMVDRRLAEESGQPPPGTRDRSAPLLDRSTVVPKKPTARTSPAPPESSGVAPRQTTSRRPKRGLGGGK